FFGAKPTAILPASAELLPNHDVPDPLSDESLSGTDILAGPANASTSPLPFPFSLRRDMMSRLRQCQSLFARPAMTGAPAATTTRAPGARLALGLLLTINLFNYIDRYILSAVLPKVGEQFHEGKARLGLLMSMFLISYTFIAPLFGWLGDRWSRWK